MPQLQPFWVPPYTVDNPGPYAETAGGINATYQANPWDTASVGGFRVPGVVSLSVNRKTAIFTIAAPGIVPINQRIGFEQLRFSMTIRLWTPAQWAEFQPLIWRIQPIFAKRPKGLTKAQAAQWQQNNNYAKSALDIRHPALAAHSVYSAIAEDLGPLVGDQVKTYTIKWLEYRNGLTSVAVVDNSEVVTNFNAETLSNQQVRPNQGGLVNYTPAQGPQQKPSQNVSLTPTP